MMGYSLFRWCIRKEAYGWTKKLGRSSESCHLIWGDAHNFGFSGSLQAKARILREEIRLTVFCKDGSVTEAEHWQKDAYDGKWRLSLMNSINGLNTMMNDQINSERVTSWPQNRTQDDISTLQSRWKILIIGSDFTECTQTMPSEVICICFIFSHFRVWEKPSLYNTRHTRHKKTRPA